MSLRRWGVAGLLAVGGVAFWLLLSGPSRWRGVDAGQAGTALLVTVAWVSMWAVSRLPRGELGALASPAEWKAWIGTGFMAVSIAYFVAHIEVFMAMRGSGDPDAGAVARNLVSLLVAWAILSRVVASRWKGEVREDERDREIAARAAGWGHCALVSIVVGYALLLGFSPAQELQWASHGMIATLLLLALMWSCLSGHAATAIQYWRDRH